MLFLNRITKEYVTGDTKVNALKGVEIGFRKNEFVSVLGPSGCGKTTLLNIIGGLDHCTDGELIINGKSTRNYKSRDWDSYRNHSVGFVFQSYNLIPHQTVLSNVELALTLSGVSKSVRRQKAKAVLEKVGLGDQISKKPNQLSGGQMQRVAIARALINDPEILLADEPTGALDTETSIQVMALLKEIANDRLVIMVTHNPELAEQYSTRIVKLLDGNVISDTDPYESDKASEVQKETGVTKKPSMSFFTALSLSLNNLFTKKTRTLLTSFAGSIGIIGIALILSMSSGAQAYIDRVEKDTLSSYPISIQKSSMDLTAMMTAMAGMGSDDIAVEEGIVNSNDMFVEILDVMLSEITSNDLASFKKYIDDDANGIKELTSDIVYGYSTPLNIYKSDTSNGIYRIQPDSVIEAMSSAMGVPAQQMQSMMSISVWSEMMSNIDLLNEQYDVVAGKMPESYNEIVIVLDEDNMIDDFTLFTLGLKDISELTEIIEKNLKGEETEITPLKFTYDELLELSFKLVLNTDYFTKSGDVWVDNTENNAYIKSIVDKAEEIRVVGILRPSEGGINASISGTVGYTHKLVEHLIGRVNESQIAIEQKANKNINVFTGLEFGGEPTIDMSMFTEEQIAEYMAMTDEEKAAFIASIMPSDTSTYEENLILLGISDLDDPSTISIYPKDFDAKEVLTTKIEEYNQRMRNDGNEAMAIQYTDYIGLIMSSISTIINTISIILMAFVGVSLVVSSIMIGIITYISVLERTKEIGILRSVGASKRDISRVFNAETLIVGLVSGAIGIGITLLLIIPINMIIESLSGIAGIAYLPLSGGVGLILISMILTFIAGLIPSKIAAKKDPVEALRTE